MTTGVREQRGTDATPPAHTTRARAAAAEAHEHDAHLRERTRAARALEGVRLTLIALWLGGAVFFSFVVAPTVFAVLPTRELAGAVVTRTIAVVNVGGFVVGLLLFALALFGERAAAGRTWRLVEAAALAVVCVACGVGHWVVAARMVALRASMGRPIDAVAAGDPMRAAFNSLHGYSVALMGAAMLAGLVALLLIGAVRQKV